MHLVVPYTKKEKYPSLPLFFPFNLTLNYATLL